jgi:hypothetical protein
MSLYRTQGKNRKDINLFEIEKRKQEGSKCSSLSTISIVVAALITLADTSSFFKKEILERTLLVCLLDGKNTYFSFTALFDRLYIHHLNSKLHIHHNNI